MVNDTISDMLTRIRNACMVKKPFVEIPYTNINQQIARILEKEGFIQSFQTSLESKVLKIQLKYRLKNLKTETIKESCIINLKRISKPSLRIYTSYKDIPRLLGGAGLIILSTPKGILSDRDARSSKIGGEILCSIW